MLKEKTLDFEYLPYGDVCKRSRCMEGQKSSEEFEAFEAELLAAVAEEIQKNENTDK